MRTTNAQRLHDIAVREIDWSARPARIDARRWNIARAYLTTDKPLSQVADHFQITPQRVSQIAAEVVLVATGRRPSFNAANRRPRV